MIVTLQEALEQMRRELEVANVKNFEQDYRDGVADTLDTVIAWIQRVRESNPRYKWQQDLEAEVQAAIHKKEVHILANRSIEDIMKMLAMEGVGDGKESNCN